MSPDADPLPDLTPLLEEIERAARERPEVRSALQRLASWIDGLVAEPPHSAPPPTVDPHAPIQEVTLPLVIGPARAEVRVSATPEELEKARSAIDARAKGAASISVRSPESDPEPAPDLAVVAARCKLKAEACRWAIVRRRRQEQRAPFDQAIKPTDQDLVRRARALPECFLWSLAAR